MYNGTNKTALQSQKQIAETFVQLMHDTPFSDISISMICKEADISRQTFYSLFQTKENLLIYLLGKRCSFIPGNMESDKPYSLECFSKECSQYIVEKREILALLDENDLIHPLHEGFNRSFLNCEAFFPYLSPLQRSFAAEFVSGGVIGIVKTYLRTDRMTKADLQAMIESLFSGKLFQLP